MDRLRNADAWRDFCSAMREDFLQEEAEKAARRFNKCLDNGRTELDLQECYLIDLPHEIWELTTLEKFYCDLNPLRTIPSG